MTKTKIPCKDIMALAIAVQEANGFTPAGEDESNANVITRLVDEGKFSLITEAHRAKADDVVLYFKGKIIEVMNPNIKTHAFTNKAIEIVSKDSFTAAEVAGVARVLAALPKQFDRAELIEQSDTLIDSFKDSKPIGRYGTKFQGAVTVLRAINSAAFGKWFLTCSAFGSLLRFSLARHEGLTFNIGDEVTVSGTVFKHETDDNGGVVTRLYRVSIRPA